jgi:peptidoglycan hydrolase-like protein with peptidoglycan-binding domain
MATPDGPGTAASACCPDKLPEPLPDPLHRGGSGGAAVVRLQRRLNHQYPTGPDVAEDGEYGPATEAAVRSFQRRAGLLVDGIAGPATLEALGLVRP